MEALVCLSKYLGAYSTWKQIKEEYQLKWSNGDSLEVFQSIFNNEQDYSAMLRSLKDTISLVPKPYANILIYDTLTGLRPTEACQSIQLIKTDLSNYLKRDRMILEHYKYPNLFIRRSKNAYISIVDERILEIAKGTNGSGYTALRSYLVKHKLTMKLGYCRKIFATYLRSNGVEQEIIDLLQGRIPKSVFARHYFRPTINLDKVRLLIEQLRHEILH